jgi:hypothetical protein
VSEPDSALLDREQMRLMFVALFMHAEISSVRAPIDSWVSNEDLAARALRRADMLLRLQEKSK